MSHHEHSQRIEQIAGCLLGMAVGDALGVPREGLPPRRAERLFGQGELRHRLFLGKGMISDDTEHACMTAQALLRSNGKTKTFASSLAWRLRWWLLGVPAGIGLATLRSIVKLWLGVSTEKSGVRSAGNGPAMRAPILGVLLAGNPELLHQTVEASTRITHYDQRTDEGALLVAAAAEYATQLGEPPANWRTAMNAIRKNVSEPELNGHLDKVEQHLEDQNSPTDLAAEMGLADKGVSGYINNTVPVAIFCWLRYPGDLPSCIEQAIRLGGDADTVAAIAGALAGISSGRAGIPEDWLNGVMEWPRSVSWIYRLAERLAEQFPGEEQAGKNQGKKEQGKYLGPQSLFWPGQLLRNLLFATIVLGHGFRRLLPPY